MIVGSMGGAPKHPQWYLNLTAEPSVTVHVKGDQFPATARTTRRIPVVVLERQKS